jgi:PAS domain S-box-containing protein
MLRRESPIAKLSAGAIVLGYVISAILWITLSDRVLGVLVGDPATLVTLSILKGWGFVALTGAVLAFLLRRLEVGRARQTSELEARENRFRLLAEHAQDVIVRYRVLPTPAFEYVSPSIEAVLGYAPAAFYADPGLLARLAHPDDRHLLRPAPGPPQVADSVVLRLQHADGHWVWLERRSTPVFDAAGTLVAIEGAARDVSDRHRAEASVARLNRVLRTHSAANAALVRAGSEAELLERLCHVVVEDGAYRNAWVGYRDDDGAAGSPAGLLGRLRPRGPGGAGRGQPPDRAGARARGHRRARGSHGGRSGPGHRSCRCAGARGSPCPRPCLGRGDPAVRGEQGVRRSRHLLRRARRIRGRGGRAPRGARRRPRLRRRHAPRTGRPRGR